MTHQEQHHEHHRKEREERIRHEHEHERHEAEHGLPFYATNVWGVGVILCFIAVLAWTFVVW